MIHRRQLLIGAVLALAVSLISGNAIAASADDFIRSAGERTFASLSKELTEEERTARFRAILLETFDLKTIARFTLGRYWRVASKKQRDDYVELFEGNYQDYEADRKRRLGEAADRPHRIKYKPLGR